MRFTKQLKCAVVLAIVATLPSCSVLSPAGGGCLTYYDLTGDTAGPDERVAEFVTFWKASTWEKGVEVKHDCLLVEGVIVRKDDERDIFEISAERRREGAKSRDIYGVGRIRHATDGDDDKKLNIKPPVPASP